MQLGRRSTGGLRAVRRAAAREDWTAVAARAHATLPTGVPRDDAQLELLLGLARFQLGQAQLAVAPLQRALAVLDDSSELTFARYALGICSLISGDLPTSRRWLRLAIDAAQDDPWLGTAVRGLVQVEAELGELDVAASLLRTTPGSDAASPLHLVLRGHLDVRRGRDDHARLALFEARAVLAAYPRRVPASEHHTIASSLTLAAATYVELAHPDEAAACSSDARQRLERSRLHGTLEAAHLDVLDAEVTRQHGDPDAARTALAALDPAASGSADHIASIVRARARATWALGAEEAAAALYEDAARRYAAIDHVWLAVAMRSEAATGPRAVTPHPPVEALHARVDATPPAGPIAANRTLDDAEGTPT